METLSDKIELLDGFGICRESNKFIHIIDVRAFIKALKRATCYSDKCKCSSCKKIDKLAGKDLI